MALTAPRRDEFLSTPRVVALATNSESGIPICVPVWFEWDGEVARMFTHKRSPKMKRLARDPRVVAGRQRVRRTRAVGAARRRDRDGERRGDGTGGDTRRALLGSQQSRACEDAGFLARIH